MKKVRNIILIAIVSLFLLTGCFERATIEKLTEEQAESAIALFYEQLQIISKKHETTVVKEESKYSGQLYADIKKDDQHIIKIYLNHYAPVDGYGGLQVMIEYFLTDHKNMDFDLDLYLDIVNLFSEKEITKEYCSNFLSSSKWSKEVADTKNDQRMKEQNVNFLMNWRLRYVLKKDESQVLTFWGDVKPVSEITK